MSHLWHKFNLFKYFWPARVGATTHIGVTTQLTFLDSKNLLSRVCCFYSKMCLFVNITCTAVLLPTKLPFHLTLDSTTMWLFVRFMNIYIQNLPSMLTNQMAVLEIRKLTAFMKSYIS